MIMVHSLRDLRSRAVTTSERHARYGVSRDALLRRSPLLAPVSTGSAASARALRPAAGDRHDQFVGMTDQASAMAERVRRAAVGKNVGKRLGVLSIVGFAGLGKTTLAMEVCRRLETEFQRQAQVSVSQAFDGRSDVSGLLRRVLQQIVKPKAGNEKGIKEENSAGDIDKMDLDTLAKTLQDLLKDKRFDMRFAKETLDWEVRGVAWDAIRSKLPENNLDSRIMVTTRIETVAVGCSDAGEISGDNIYHIQPLNSEDSRKLFLSRAFGSKDATCPKELEDEMDKILKKCGGLPLAIVSISSLLASYKSPEHKDMWDRVCKSISYHMENNPTLEGMKQILTLSYDHLPYHLKGCMMYLSIFPEDFLINKDRLLYRWIAEGLVEEKRGMTLMEVAEAYYDELVSRSMITPAGEIISHVYGAVETCRVHDMMLEIMVSKSLEANFVSLIGGQYQGMSYDTIRCLSVHSGGQRPKEFPFKKDDSASKKPSKDSSSKKKSLKNGLEEINVQHVRSLSMFQLEGNKLLDRLDEFTLLRALDLEDCKGVKDKHMGDICRMYLLRYLSLRGTDISVLPPKVRELEHLQTLDVRATNIVALPESVIKLEKLERLFFSQKDVWETMWKPPKGLWKMKALREVGWVVLEDDAVRVAQEIGELEDLQRLSIYVNCDGSKSSGAKVLKELAQSLSKTYSLRSLDMEMPKVHRFEEGSMSKLEKLELNFHGWTEKSIVGIEHLMSLKEVQLTGKRDNPALDRALKQLKAESERRPNQFTVGVKEARPQPSSGRLFPEPTPSSSPYTPRLGRHYRTLCASTTAAAPSASRAVCFAPHPPQSRFFPNSSASAARARIDLRAAPSRLPKVRRFSPLLLPSATGLR
nr:unnamed protein product [Digitaria exilis]